MRTFERTFTTPDETIAHPPVGWVMGTPGAPRATVVREPAPQLDLPAAKEATLAALEKLEAEFATLEKLQDQLSRVGNDIVSSTERLNAVDVDVDPEQPDAVAKLKAARDALADLKIRKELSERQKENLLSKIADQKETIAKAGAALEKVAVLL
jgi:hypothetical protein